MLNLENFLLYVKEKKFKELKIINKKTKIKNKESQFNGAIWGIKNYSKKLF